MSVRLYLDDPDLLEFDATVVDRRLVAGEHAVVLDRTAFYPEGGGQPWDTGSLGGAAVRKVVYDGDTVLHFLDRELAETRVRGRVDAARRRDHMQQHHGQHLLSRAVLEVAGGRTTSFHLGANDSSIDIDKELSPQQVAAAESRVNDVIWENRPVSVRTVTRAQAEAIGVQAAAEAGDAIRLVEAEGFDLQPCGGTHPRSTAAVGVVLVTGQERYKSGSRLHFVCGMRALEVSRQRRDTLARIGSALSAPPEETAAAVERALARTADAEKAQQALMKRLVELEAERLRAAHGDGIVRARLDGWAMTDLRSLAQLLLGGGATLVVLGGVRDGAASILMGTSRETDLRPHLAAALAALGGKGGGQPRLVQGTGTNTGELDGALAAAEAAGRAAVSG